MSGKSHTTKRPVYQVRREDLSDDQWHHLTTVAFPLVKRLKAKAARIMLERGAEKMGVGL